ncbi:MAG: hypothetical protein QXG65_01830 [Thermoplasmata archaeon]
MRHRPRSDPRGALRLCPQCGSARIVFELAYITGQLYRCQACGYVGPLVFEIDTPSGTDGPAGDPPSG